MSLKAQSRPETGATWATRSGRSATNNTQERWRIIQAKSCLSGSITRKNQAGTPAASKNGKRAQRNLSEKLQFLLHKLSEKLQLPLCKLSE